MRTITRHLINTHVSATQVVTNIGAIIVHVEADGESVFIHVEHETMRPAMKLEVRLYPPRSDIHPRSIFCGCVRSGTGDLWYVYAVIPDNQPPMMAQTS